jgi:Bacterial SH3 domain
MKFLLVFLCSTVAVVAATQPNEAIPATSASPSDETDSNSFHGVVDDPDGYVNLRSKPNAKSAIVAKVQKGERFTFQRHEYDPWCSVKLASGKTGWMDAQRILLSFTKDDLPEKAEEGDDMAKVAERHGIDYYGVAWVAVRGDDEARKKFFRISEFADGAAAEEHEVVLGVVIHLIGDDALAAFLRSQPIAFQVSVRNSIEDDAVTFPFRSDGYLFHHFPKTWKIFFRRELTDWPSPNGKYAVHKVFSDEYTDEDSKVTRAELLNKASGKRVFDLTREDHRFGRNREGDVEWAPDSKGFLFSTSRTANEQEMKLFYLLGESFQKIELPQRDKPPTEQAPEIGNAAYYDQGYEEIHWQRPGALSCDTTYIYKTTGADGSPSYLYRIYERTMTIGADGKLNNEGKWLPRKKGEE